MNRGTTFAVLPIVAALVAATLPADVHALKNGPGTSSGARLLAARAATQCEATSPPYRVALVELFTSEGCSSCPPADRWLQRLGDGGARFDRVVPLSLHVGYWDAIGWKDPFAQQRFTDRQREYARLRGSRSVYTPQVVLSGADFRGWSGGAFASAVDALGRRTASADIALSAAAVGDKVRVDARTATPAGTELHLAVFEMGLTSRVTRGENSGETLSHDYVVRQWLGPLVPGEAGTSATHTIALDAAQAGRRLGVAAFVQATGGEVLQATACLLE